MVMIQPELLIRNNGASTSDWIGQVKGQVIYAYDLSALIARGQLVSEGLSSSPATISGALKLEDYELGITYQNYNYTRAISASNL